MTIELANKEEMTSLAEKVSNLEIVDQRSFGLSAIYNVDIEKMKKVIKDHYKPLKDAANKAHKAITSQEKRDLAPIELAGNHVRKIRSAYVQKEEEKRRKKQAKLDEAAEKKAEKEREKLRIKAEAEEDDEKKQELKEQAEEVYAQPNIVEPAIAKSSKVEGGGGISWVDETEVTITDEMHLLQEVVKGNVPLTVIEFKPAKIKSWVKAMAIKNGQIEGIRITTKKVERVRTA